MKILNIHINEKFTEGGDVIKHMGIGVEKELKSRYWIIPDEKIDKILNCEHEILFYKNTYVLIYQNPDTGNWQALSDIYPKSSGSYINSIDTSKEKVIRRVKLGIGKKLNRMLELGQLSEKFTKESDPIEDMGIIVPEFKLYQRMHNSAKKAEKLGIFSYVSDINWNIEISKNKKTKYEKEEKAIYSFISADLLGSFSIDSNHENYYKERNDKGRKTRNWIIQKDKFKIFLVKKQEGGYYIQIYNVLGNQSHFPQTLAGFLMHTRAVKPINEKFTPESDPIADMGIGIKNKIFEITKKCYSFKSGYYSPKEWKDIIEWMLEEYEPWEVIAILDNKIMRYAYDHSGKEQATLDDFQIYNVLYASKRQETEIDRVLNHYRTSDSKISEYYRDIAKKAGLFKEPMYEKFTEKSDPIKDLGIGIFVKRTFDNIDDGANFMLQALPAILGTNKIPNDIIIPATEENTIFRFNGKYWMDILKYVKKYIVAEPVDSLTIRSAILSATVYELYRMGYPKKVKEDIRENVNEKFSKESDPIKDMGIGTLNAINYSMKELDKLDTNDKHLLKYWTTDEHGNYFNIIFSTFMSYDELIKAKNYVNKLVKKSGLGYFLIGSGIIIGASTIHWSIKDEFKKYFKAAYFGKVNEKFSEEASDPIADMGIGGYTFDTLKDGAIIRCNKSFGTTKGGVIRGYASAAIQISYGSYFVIFNIKRIDKYYISFDYKNVGGVSYWIYSDKEEIKQKELECLNAAKEYAKHLLRMRGINLKYLKSRHISKIGKNKFDNMFKIIERGVDVVHESLNEKFTDITTDPIADMGIGGYSWDTVSKGALIKLKPSYRSLVSLTKNNSGQFSDIHGMRIRHEYCLVVTQVVLFNDGYKDIHIKIFPSDELAKEYKEAWKSTSQVGWGGMNNRMIVSKRQFERRFDIIERGFDLVKESLNEKFTDKSDPIGDMGIGAKPRDILDQFLIDFIHEFGVEPYVDFCGGDYDVPGGDVFLIEGQHTQANHPINLLLSNSEGTYGFDFAMNDKAAEAIDKRGAKWGFFYWNKGKVVPIKSKDMKGVIKEILKIRKYNSRTLDSAIRKYESYVNEVKKMKSIYNES